MREFAEGAWMVVGQEWEKGGQAQRSGHGNGCSRARIGSGASAFLG